MARVESQIPAPTTPDAPSLADWAEAIMFIEMRENISRSALRQRLKGALAVEAEDIEIEIDLLIGEVSRRDRIASETYPFKETNVGVGRKHISEEALYEFLLWLSISPQYRQENRYNEIEEPFDQLVKQALISYLGSSARGVRFAHPSSDGRPANFPQAIQWLAGLLNLSTGKAIPRPCSKDAGLDVVVWQPFKDGRSGFITILCQCTVELDWTPKAKDIVLGNWLGLIDFGLHPITVLAIPFAVPLAFEKWDELRRTVNIVLDRFRLCELVRPEELQNIEAIKSWSSNERQFLAQIYET